MKRNGIIHRKPSTPYEYLRLDGRKVTFDLPITKTAQEKRVIEDFCELFSKKISNIEFSRQGKEDDNDFYLKFKDKEVIVELTEMNSLKGVEGLRSVNIKGNYGFLIPDSRKEVILLREAIKSKVQKGYSKTKQDFWLVVYQIETFPSKMEATISCAREYIKTCDFVPFDKIWYFHPDYFIHETPGIILPVWPLSN